MKIHRLHCQDPWFTFIRQETKTVEGRKNLPQFKDWQVGDTLIFFLDEKEFCTKIIDLRHYSSLEDYLRTEGIAKVLPGVKSLEEGLAIYYQWSKPEEIIQYGFLAIEVERI